MFRRKTSAILGLFLLFFSVGGCVKDVDLSQVDEVMIPPTAAIDLVYFTLEAQDFHTKNTIKTAQDSLRLEFLDDSYVQDGLVRAEFTFKYFNTFPQGFESKVVFLNENNKIQYQFSFPIAPGNAGAPRTTTHVEVVDVQEIQKIRNSIKMKIALKALPSSQPFAGKLQLKSRAFYSFEF